MPRNGGITREQVADGLEELIAAAGPPEAPADLGNFRPSSLTADPPAATERPEPPAPEPPEPADIPDDDDAPPPPADDVSDRLARVERENEFLRLAMQRPASPAAPPPPTTPQDAANMVDRALGGFAVTPDDVETILRDPVKGAAYLQNGIRAAAAAGAAMAIQQARAEYQQDQGQRTQSTQLRDLMYSRHPDLEVWADNVMLEAQRVYAEHPNLPATQLCDETARRTKATLAARGVTFEKSESKKVRRLRPAFAEGSGGGGRQGQKSLTSFEKELFQLVNAR